MSANAVEAPPQATAADFQALENKVLRTIELLKTAREAQANAQRDATRLREQLGEREEEVETMRSELIALRKEREEVRTRVEKMLTQIDSLTADESAS
jgi:TolA-binding protein